MISASLQELLSAYVDGELSTRQRKVVLKLLQRSADARAYLRILQEDAARLRKLPKQKSPAGSAERVLVATHKLPKPRPQAQPKPTRQLPAWQGLSAAAAVLLAVGVGAFLYFSQSAKPRPFPDVVRAENVEPEKPTLPEEVRTKPDSGDNLPEEKPTPKPIPKPDPLEKTPTVVENQPSKTDPPLNEKDLESVFGHAPAPLPAMEFFTTPSASKSPLFLVQKLREIESEKFLKEVQGEQALHLELPCVDSHKAFDRTQAMLRSQGVGVTLEEVAQFRRNRPALKTNYVFYLEDVQEGELLKMLQQLVVEDRVPEKNKKPTDYTVFESVIVQRFSERDKQALRALLGLQAKALEQPPSPPDPKKPISASTADQLVQTLKGEGNPRPETSNTPSKAIEKFALALPYNPARPLQNSAQVKRYLESRKPARPGTFSMLLVLRGL